MLKRSCCYQVDAHDKIIAVSGAWSAFARDNGGESLLNNPPIGRSIWEFINGLATRNIYFVIMNQVRNSGRAVRFPFRCDSPEKLRYMEMKVSLGDDNSLWFETTLSKEIPKESTLASIGRSQQFDRFIQMCAWCNCVQVGEEWHSIVVAIWALGLFDTPEAPPITHGMCPDCVHRTNQQHQNWLIKHSYSKGR